MKKPFFSIALLAAVTAYAQQTAQPSTQQPGAQTQPGQTQTTQPNQPQPGMQSQQPSQPGAQQQTQPGTQPQQPTRPGMQQQPGQPGTQQQPGQPGAQQPGQPGAQPQPGQPGAQPQPGQPGAQQQPGQPGAQPGQQPAPAAPEVQQVQIQVPPPQKAPEIKDPAEYQAYVSAIQQGNPQAKITALEGFLQTYPNSVVKVDAIDALMRAYQQSGNVAKTQETAQRLLQADPNNIPALALLAYLGRTSLESGGVAAAQAPQVTQQVMEYGRRGLEALPKMPRPEGETEQQYMQLATSARQIFEGAIGFAALQQKNYPEAQQYLSLVAKEDPNGFTNIYQLGLAYLEPQPPNPLGFWYVARAAALAPPAAQAQVANYGKSKYMRYHGGDDGWQEILTSARNSSAPPSNFTVAPAPSPAEIADKLVKEKPVAQMSFDEIQMVLTSGNQPVAEQVWNQLKDKPIAIEGKVVNPTPEKLQIAGTYEDINSNPPKADIDLTMALPLGPKLLPQANSTIQFQGVPTTYDADPFMVHMEKGCIIKGGKCIAGQESPTTRTAPRRRGTTPRRSPSSSRPRSSTPQ